MEHHLGTKRYNLKGFIGRDIYVDWCVLGYGMVLALIILSNIDMYMLKQWLLLYYLTHSKGIRNWQVSENEEEEAIYEKEWGRKGIFLPLGESAPHSLY